MPSEYALQRSAQAWCTSATEHLEMNSALAFAFADILDQEIARFDAELAKRPVTVSATIAPMKAEDINLGALE